MSLLMRKVFRYVERLSVLVLAVLVVLAGLAVWTLSYILFTAKQFLQKSLKKS